MKDILLIIIFFILLIFIAVLGICAIKCLNIRVFDGGRHKAHKRDAVKDLTKHPRSKSEAAIIKIAEEIIGCKMPTINPAWLTMNGRTLELDGYCPEKKVALEFSGPHHTKWFPKNEEYARYLNRIEADRVKKRICAEQGVLLIVVDMRLPKYHWRNYILSRLYDWRPDEYDKPNTYIAAQEEEPFIR
jgi:hypothetical protein